MLKLFQMCLVGASLCWILYLCEAIYPFKSLSTSLLSVAQDGSVSSFTFPNSDVKSPILKGALVPLIWELNLEVY